MLLDFTYSFNVAPPDAYGEIPDPPNPERMKEIIDGIDKYCIGTDAELAALKVRYATNPTIMDKLNQYEPNVEPKKQAQ